MDTNSGIAFQSQIDKRVSDIESKFFPKRMKKNISKHTENFYATAWDKYIEKFDECESKGLPLEIDFSCMSARNIATGAIRRKMKDLLDDAKSTGSKFDLFNAVTTIESHMQVVDSFDREGDTCSDKQMQSSLRDFEQVNPDWRIQLDESFKSSLYYAGYIVQRVSGCRPEELSQGVEVKRFDETSYLLIIKTVKLRQDVLEDGGSTERYIVSNHHELGQFVDTTVTVSSAKNYQSWFKYHCSSVFGVPLTPYNLRYAVMADLKSSLSKSTMQEQAEFIGHSVVNKTNIMTYQGWYNEDKDGLSAREVPAYCVVPRKCLDK